MIFKPEEYQNSKKFLFNYYEVGGILNSYIDSLIIKGYKYKKLFQTHHGLHFTFLVDDEVVSGIKYYFPTNELLLGFKNIYENEVQTMTDRLKSKNIQFSEDVNNGFLIIKVNFTQQTNLSLLESCQLVSEIIPTI